MQYDGQEQNRLELIEKLVDYLHKKMPDNQAPIMKPFVRQYYLSVSPEEMSNKSLDELYGSIISHWNFINVRKDSEIKIRTFNPNIEQHGWQNKHTVIQIVVEDMPFLVDSLRMALNKLGINIYTILNVSGMTVSRNKKDGKLKTVHIYEEGNEVAPEKDCYTKVEIPIYIEIDKQSDLGKRKYIEKTLEDVLKDVKLVVDDWPKMKEQVSDILLDYEKNKEKMNNVESIEENIDFLKWVSKDHFTYLGSQDYLVDTKTNVLTKIEETAYGLCKNINGHNFIEKSNFLKEEEVLCVCKTGFWSTVHRPVYTDALFVKIFNKKQKLEKIRVIMGLFTAEAYNDNPVTIPLIKEKIKNVIKRSGFEPKSHAGKKMMNILVNMPRDYLLQSDSLSLYQFGIGIFYIQERNQLKVFIRRDRSKQFFSCLVFVPRENFNSNIRIKFQKVLMSIFNGLDITFTTIFSETILIKVYFLIKVNPTEDVGYDVKAIEQKFKDISRTWSDDLEDALIESFGEEKTLELHRIYANAFPESYKENFMASMAVLDIKYIEVLNENQEINMTLYRLIEDKSDILRFKLYRLGKLISLSDIVPMLENLGIKVISERPYQIKRNGRPDVWINDYKMKHAKNESLDAEILKDIFQDAFYAVWEKKTENDELNKLVLNASLKWYEIYIVRAYARFLWQLKLSFSRYYVANVLNNNPVITEKLVKYFIYKFDPLKKRDNETFLKKENEIEELLEKVNSLNEDRILRKFFFAIKATLRTSYFQLDDNGERKPYISLKVDSKSIPEIPLPIPMFEVFVYSPFMEGVHLRTSKVARGGLRWSDRNEDFRTEILGLVKAQEVKNSVIVPSGAKGGFIVKKSIKHLSRDEMMEEVVNCYKTFISGILDLSDNRFKDKVITPKNIIKYDDEDPYLVVAADKGTATFSDIANQIALDKGFWLGDAFASGGTYGYDHKKMGITARGAWESVKEHFMNLSIDVQKQDFTVIGIGDMGGDVFGNGMLLSNKIRLIAAYNHLHIFVDPDASSEVGYKERQRLFNLPRSSWNDYNKDLISEGGGVFWRSAKFIPISKQMKKRFNIKEDKLQPNLLIKKILQSQVDLIWNGGIGTFIKSSSEKDDEVGDRENDGIRVNANEVNARVIGEGGNLGLTQLGRVELSKNNVLVNTDAIDNSAGVNCSDHEVNIKILLNEIVSNGDMTIKQRDKLLVEMTEEVANLVLDSNKIQAQAISVESIDAHKNIDMHVELIKFLEKYAGLKREIEYLPSNKEIANRKLNNKGLTRPEIAVIMAYTKNLLQNDLVCSKVPDERWFYKFLVKYFPTPLQENYEKYMPMHRLKRDIISDSLANLVVDEMGVSFVYRLQQETGTNTSDIVKAYIIARELFDVEDFRNSFKKLKFEIRTDIQFKITIEFDRLIRRATRWMLRNRRSGIVIEEAIEYFKEPVQAVIKNAKNYIKVGNVSLFNNYNEELVKAGVEQELIDYIKTIPALYSVFDIVEAALLNNIDTLVVCELYFNIGHILSFGWLRDTLRNLSIANKWQALARSAFRDDLDKQQRNITVSILLNCSESEVIEEKINEWINKYKPLIERWENFIVDMKTTQNHEFSMFSVALRELLDLSQISSSCG